jgi:methionyl-tRNA formyltransferase
MQLQPSPVKQVAVAAGIPVHQPGKAAPPSSSALAEAASTCWWWPPTASSCPGRARPARHGCLNIHCLVRCLRWRGAAPIHRAIQAGDAETGITIMQMDAGLDTGPMLLSRAEAIHADDTTGSLHDRLAQLGAEMIVEALRALPGGLTATPQPADGVTYAAKIGKAEASVDWNRPAAEIERAIRAFNPSPAPSPRCSRPRQAVAGAGHRRQRHAGEVLLAEGAGVIVACGEGALCITELQKPGGKRLPAAEFLRGMPIAAGSRFDSKTCRPIEFSAAGII